AASYLRDNVDRDLRVYVEYTNEFWTDGFDQKQYLIDRGKELLGRRADDPGAQYYGIRSAEVADIFTEVFGAREGDRLFPVLTFPSRTTSEGNVLYAPDWVKQGNAAPIDSNFRVYSIDTYFGFEFGYEENVDTIRQWMQEPDGGFDRAFHYIRTGEGLVQEEGLEDFRGYYEYHANVARDLGLEFVSYEGGSGTNVDLYEDLNEDGINDYQDLIDFTIQLNRHPEMESIYRELYQVWRDAGGGQVLHYADITFPNWYGSWGLWDYVFDDAELPRQSAVLDINRAGIWWDDSRPTATFFDEPPSVITGDGTSNSLGGTDGDDVIRGRRGDDRLRGLSGDDTLDGGRGRDRLFGGNGRDSLIGRADGDRLYGNDGNDTLLGGTGSDRLFGDEGDDVLFGGKGDDTLKGDSHPRLLGNDVYVLARGEGTDSIRDFQVGEDLVGLSGSLSFSDLSLERVGRSTAIEVGRETLAILKNVAPDELSAADFIQM
ncbi:MAG: calcium-binding protein, partial [Cyanobacteria bacterium J06639_1]